VLADKGYHGAGDPVLTPYRGRNKPASQKDANRAHARLRSPGERASAQLKTWHILRKLRCCPWKAGHWAKAIHVLQAREIARWQGSVPDEHGLCSHACLRVPRTRAVSLLTVPCATQGLVSGGRLRGVAGGWSGQAMA
jgi:hypothetical protein